MNDPLPAESAAPDELQFDQAEYASPTAPAETVCGACKRPIADTYFALNNLILCPECRDRVEQHWRGGSPVGRFARAVALGVIGAVGGFVVYFGVAKLTGMEIGLIAILVGLLVGGAVRKGSGGRGGPAYQGLAMFLTYSAIAASYLAFHLPPQLLGAMPLGFLIQFAYELPVRAGFEQPIGLFIVGFAIWEAWKINRRVNLVIQGPFTLVPDPAASGPAHV